MQNCAMAKLQLGPGPGSGLWLGLGSGGAGGWAAWAGGEEGGKAKTRRYFLSTTTTFMQRRRRTRSRHDRLRDGAEAWAAWRGIEPTLSAAEARVRPDCTCEAPVEHRLASSSPYRRLARAAANPSQRTTAAYSSRPLPLCFLAIRRLRRNLGSICRGERAGPCERARALGPSD